MLLRYRDFRKVARHNANRARLPNAQPPVWLKSERPGHGPGLRRVARDWLAQFGKSLIRSKRFEPDYLSKSLNLRGRWVLPRSGSRVRVSFPAPKFNKLASIVTPLATQPLVFRIIGVRLIDKLPPLERTLYVR